MPPRILRKGSFIFDEVSGGVHAQSALDLERQIRGVQS